MKYILAISFSLILFSCSNVETKNTEKANHVSVKITNLSNEEYPDNPDLGYMASDYQNQYFSFVEMVRKDNGNFNLYFLGDEESIDTILLEDINLMELIPVIPEYLKEDEYFSLLSLVNQEWNRNQVKFIEGEFQSTNKVFTRVDLARNCLNSYLWEIIVYKREGGQTLPYTHGWFDFPENLYAGLFEERNGIKFEKYKEFMENWKDPKSEILNVSILRTVTDTMELSYSDESDEMYPLEGARKKKFKEIIYPKSFETMRDLQNDSTLYATFTPPGFYNKADPRATELGRIRELLSLNMYSIQSPISIDSLVELRLVFKDDSNRITQFVVGGFDLNSLPKLNEKEVVNGWKNSMGFSNHSFYESYSAHLEWKSNKNSYYAYLADEEEKWLDSHKVGIDGPVMYFDNEGLLHLWLLSFERHSFVGHYVINF